MKLRKKIVSIVMTTAMVATSVFGTVSVNAQTVYDPLNTEEGNHGIKIDTSAVPDVPGKIEYSAEDRQIEAVRNVKFQLYCCVDAAWTIEPAADIAATAKGVSIGKDGMVKIAKDATGGNYTIKAAAENVRDSKTVSLDLHVNASTDAAMAEKIYFDKEAMDDDQVTISEDGKTMTVEGTVRKKEMVLKYEPAYILDETVSFQASKAADVYALENGIGTNTAITTLDRSQGVTITGQVGTGTTQKTTEIDPLKVIVKDVNLQKTMNCPELAGTAGKYDLMLDQMVNFNLVTNEAATLPDCQITDIRWVLKQNSEAMESTGTEPLTYTLKDPKTGALVQETKEHQVYSVKDKDGSGEVAKIYVSDRHISVITAKKVAEKKEVVPVAVTGTFSTASDNAGNDAQLPSLTLNFNTSAAKQLTDVNVDFEKAGMIPEVDFVKKERAITVDGEEKDVYYLEADNTNLNLAAATFANVAGVRGFEESKGNSFASGQDYEIKYVMETLPESVFGSEASAGKYNMKLDSTEMTDKGVLNANNIFTRKNTGYVKLTTICDSGSDNISRNEMYLRFLSPASSIISQLKVSKDSKTWYSLDAGEVVHIRQGESVKPGDYVFNSDSGQYEPQHVITDFDPFIEYKISNIEVAKASSVDGEYRINGLSHGIVTVTAIGAVNKAVEKSFTLYVNEDIMEPDFSINFSDAQASNHVSTGNEIDGKQNKVPVSVHVETANAGTPILEWSLDCDSSVATIDQEGVITTYKSSDGEEITVTARSKGGKERTLKFTIKKVEATKIVGIAEAPTAEGNTILTDVKANAGTCMAGQSFTLYPSSYEPTNATGMGESTIKWSSEDPTKATVNETTGEVTALAETGETPVKITATYTASGKTPTTAEFLLTIKGEVNALTGIDAKDIILDHVGATATIKLDFQPGNTPNKSVKYVSSDKSVAIVNESGTVTALKAGTCTITITSNAKPSVSKTIKVTVQGVTVTPTPAPLPQTPQPSAPAGLENGATKKVSGITYKVTNASTKTIAVNKVTGSKAKIKSKVTINGVSYKITSIANNAFKNNKKLKSVVIGPNVKTIGKQAFYGCKKLTKVTIQSKVLKSVGSKAFAKGSKKITVTVPKKKASSYKKMLKKAKISSKAKYKKK